MSTIKPEDLKNEDNHTLCECGNTTIHAYSWQSADGNISCPTCMVEWQSRQIEALMKLVFKISELSIKETEKVLVAMYADLQAVNVEDIEDEIECFHGFKAIVKYQGISSGDMKIKDID